MAASSRPPRGCTAELAATTKQCGSRPVRLSGQRAGRGTQGLRRAVHVRVRRQRMDSADLIKQRRSRDRHALTWATSAMTSPIDLDTTPLRMRKPGPLRQWRHHRHHRRERTRRLRPRDDGERLHLGLARSAVGPRVDRQSRQMNDKITATGRYGVSILASDQEPLSCTLRGATGADLVQIHHEKASHSSKVLWSISPARSPIHPAGDHAPSISARVDELWYGDGCVFRVLHRQLPSARTANPDEAWGSDRSTTAPRLQAGLGLNEARCGTA